MLHDKSSKETFYPYDSSFHIHEHEKLTNMLHVMISLILKTNDGSSCVRMCYRHFSPEEPFFTRNYFLPGTIFYRIIFYKALFFTRNYFYQELFFFAQNINARYAPVPDESSHTPWTHGCSWHNNVYSSSHDGPPYPSAHWQPKVVLMDNKKNIICSNNKIQNEYRY